MKMVCNVATCLGMLTSPKRGQQCGLNFDAHRDYWCVENSDTERYIYKRKSVAVPRLYPHMTPESHGEEYFYSQLLLYKPWRNEQVDLIANPAGGSYPSYSEAFLRQGQALAQRHTVYHPFAEGMEQAVQRLEV
jgi:hypothetical protein